MSSSTWHIVYTIALLAIFIAIVVWAWSGRRKKAFRDAANLPFADEEQERRTTGARRSGEKEKGDE